MVEQVLGNNTLMGTGINIEAAHNHIERLRVGPSPFRDTLITASVPFAGILCRVHDIITSLKEGENPFCRMDSIVSESLTKIHEVSSLKDVLLSRCSEVLSVVNEAIAFMNQQLLEGSFPPVEELDQTGKLFGMFVGAHVILIWAKPVLQVCGSLISGIQGWGDGFVRGVLTCGVVYSAFILPMRIAETLGGMYPDHTGLVCFLVVFFDAALFLRCISEIKSRAQDELNK